MPKRWSEREARIELSYLRLEVKVELVGLVGGMLLAEDAQRVIRNGWAHSSAGRKALREQRAANARDGAAAAPPVR